MSISCDGCKKDMTDNDLVRGTGKLFCVECSTEVGTPVERVVNGCGCGVADCTYEQGELYWHEALDRSHVACDHFYEYVQQHPAVQHDKELEELAIKVTDAMQDFYQKVGSKCCEFEDR